MAQTWRIPFIVDIGGVATDLDSLPKLSSSDGSYGIKNTATGVVIVDDGTSMVKLSTGSYYYDITVDAEANPDHADYSTQYTVSIEYTLNGVTSYFTKTHTTDAQETSGESTLTPTYEDLVTEITDNFQITNTALQARLIKAAYLQFLYPPKVSINRQEIVGYQWNFLHPVYTLTTVADDADYDAEAWFGGMIGSEWIIDSTTLYPSLKVVSVQEMEVIKQGTWADSYPQYITVRPKAFTPTTGSRYEFLVWPTPNAAYTIKGAVNVNPDAIISGQYPIGGVQHALTIRASVRARAEMHESGGKMGAHWDDFMNCLTASIQEDMSMRPRNLGAMLEESDQRPIYDPRGMLLTYGGTDLS